MLSENKTVRQRPGEGFRRWFIDDFFDLIIWYDDSQICFIGFQLCYEKGQNERAVTFKIEEDSSTRSHRFVTSTPDAPARKDGKMTAVLKGDAGPLDPAVIDRFARESGELDADLKAMILKELRHFV